VKHSHVVWVGDWPHFTFHRYVTEGIYLADWGGAKTTAGAETDFGE
jgi:putative transposase